MTAAQNSEASHLLNLDEVTNGQRIGRFSVLLLLLAILTLVSDGFDIAAIGYIGPELVKEWGITPAQLAPVFSAGIIGLFLGAPLVGYFGDRFGRRTAIIAALCAFGGLTLATVLVTSVTQLVVCRFLTGVGLGGLIPNVIALTAEMAPRRLRGRFIAIVNFGVTVGLGSPGLVGAALVPQYGWKSLLVVGGALPLLIALLAMIVLPESIKYLAQRPGREDEVRRLAARLRPDLSVGPATRFASTPAGAHASGSPGQLFAGDLKAITPLLWFALATNQMVNFFVLSWLPTLLQSAGSTTVQASVAASMFAIGGLVGGLFVTLLVDRLGVIPLVLLFIVGVPAVAAIGATGVEPGTFRLIVAIAGFCTTGINFGMNVTLGSIYLTPVRSMGTGWAQAVGRLGSLVAPILGGVLLGMHLPLRDLLLAPAATLAAGALACAALAFLCVRRFGGYRLHELSAAERRSATSHTIPR